MPKVTQRFCESQKKLQDGPVQRCFWETGSGAPGWPPSGWQAQAGPGGREGTASLEVVLALAVPPQVHLALEALGAELAAEGLEARVLPAVGDEVGALAEGLAAHLALVGLLTCRNRGGRGGSVSL